MTICTYDSNTDYSEIIGASAASYTSNSGTSKTNNRLSGAAAMGTVALNLLPNAGLEQCTNNVSDGWVSLPFSQNAAAGVIAKSRTRIGCASLKTAASGSGMYHEVALQAGTTYTFSGYVNTRDITAYQSDGGVYLAVLTAAQRSSLAGVQRSPWKSEIVNYTTAPEVDAGWEKISVTFTPDTSGTYSLAFVQDKADGTAYCDDMQLEAHAAASNANLVQNGTFASGAPDFWTANRYTKSSEHPLGAGKGVSMHAEGSSVGGTRTSQVVPINYYAGLATFLLSGWGKANSVGGTSPKPEKDGERYFGLIAEIKYAKEDGTEISETENQYVSFNDDFTDWQYASGVIIPKRRDLMVKNITVYCAYDYNANDAYFTNISLVLEPAETYSYDSKGNPIAATDGNAKTSSEFFADSQRLKSYTTPGGAKHTLAYDTRNNLEQDTLAGLTNYTYHNASGSATTSITSVGTSGDYLKSYNVYDSTGRFRTQSTDANGVTTKYEYEPGAARLFRSTAANGTKQGYHYADNSDRVDFTYIDGTASIDYDYDRAQLTDLIRKAFPQAADASGNNVNPFWQHYLLGYDAFGNMTRVQVCASSAERAGYTAPITLATYEYEGNVYNGRLAKMTYGNKDSVSYTYDAFDRQRTAAYNDVDRTTHEQKNVATYHYDYSSDNALTRQYATGSDGKITEQYSYQYDSLGRLIHSRQSTGTGALIQSTQHMYDAANRMTSQTWQFGTGLYHQQYSYTGVKADGATSTLYYYVLNAQGDVTALLDSAGALTWMYNLLFSRK